eukprot:TRINITY_DN5784_c0_g1_i2.p1 TRINITY_DN5784_c0_g1~~TRINITY_DN5784_c0_g1_i2.p1  ORF type:complete len:274 (+),score=106.47 TRINITY_DN5784_c0_g1_i2:625-1446(+)
MWRCGGGAFARQRRRLFVRIHETPNEHSRRFQVPADAGFMKEGTREYAGANVAYDSPLAAFLFRVPGIRSVMIGPEDVVVTKDPASGWTHLGPQVCEVLTAFNLTGEAAVYENALAETPYPDTHPDPADGETLAAVKELIAGEVRDMVRQDGGDIRLVGFDEDEGVVLVTLQGACSTCNSSSSTLRDAVHRTLAHWLPEVAHVVRVTPTFAEEFRAAGSLAATGRSREDLEEEMEAAFEASAEPDAAGAASDDPDADLKWQVRGGGGEGACSR